MLYTINSGNALNKQQKQKLATMTNHREEGEIDIQNCYTVIFRVPSFQQENYAACKETRKYGTFTEKEEINRNCSKKTLDLLDKDFYVSCRKYAEILKEIMGIELRETRRTM